MTLAKGADRFGISEEEAVRLQVEMRSLIARMPAARTRHENENGWPVYDFGNHLLDWEAELLRQVFDHFKNVSPDVCVLLAHLVRASENQENQDYVFPRSVHMEKRAEQAKAVM